MFLKFWKKDPRNHRALTTYTRMMAQARTPVFFEKWGVDDTLEGRFEVLSLHLALVLIRLKAETGEKEKEFAQVLFDLTFLEIDRALREIGVGDASIGKKIKKFIRNFYGRLEAYDTALEDASHADEKLRQALARNVYDAKIQPEEVPTELIDYIRILKEHLQKTPFQSFESKIFEFPELSKHAA